MKLLRHIAATACASVVLSIILIAAKPEDEIKSKQSELKKLKDQIQQYEEKIQEREKKEHAALDLLDTYEKQEMLLRKLLRELHQQEKTLEQNIAETRNTIAELGGKVTHLKGEYAHYVSNVYRYGRIYDIELLLASHSLNQMLIRSEYLRRFTSQRKVDVDKIITKRQAIEEENIKLQHQLSEQRELLADKAKEEATLQQKMKKRKQLLTTIRHDKKLLRQEANRTISAAQELEGLITKLIEEDRIRKEREAARAKEEKIRPAPTPEGKAFVQRRGKLRWPVSQGKVVARFGNQQHAVLKTITQNTGIDIQVPNSTAVTAVADAQVSTISWLPSFGNLIILDHSGGYRTVYAHLSEISVSEGDQIDEGGIIGKSGESFSYGSSLHFEIWKDREKQDPEHWLSPRGLTKR